MKIAEECIQLSNDEKITFKEVVMRLDAAGIESYSANLLAANTIFYAGNQAHTVPMRIKAELKIANTFNQEAVISALRAIQGGHIRFQEFLKKIMEAGVIFYLVFIKGRKAIYFGRNGEQYTESFGGN